MDELVKAAVKRAQKAALAAKLAEKEAALAAAAYEESKNTPIPAITVSEFTEPEEVEAHEGGQEAVAAVSEQGLVRQGTKRVSVMKRKPSKIVKSRTPEEKAAEDAAVQEAHKTAEIVEEEDESALSGRQDSEPGIEVTDVAPVNLVSTGSPSKSSGSGGDSAAKNGKGGAHAGHNHGNDENNDPYAAMWAGFVIPMKLSKFKMDAPGREVCSSLSAPSPTFDYSVQCLLSLSIIFLSRV